MTALNPNLPKLEHKNGKWYDWSPVSAKQKDVAQAYAKYFKIKYPALAIKLNGRIERAAEIVSTIGACVPLDNEWEIGVRSQSNPRGFYIVDANRKTCTCPDAGKHPDLICKHRLAVGFHLFGGEWIYEFHINEMEQTRQAHKAAEAAWKISNDIASQYENIDPSKYDEPETQELRDRMLKATNIASELQDRFNELVNPRG